MSDLTKDVLAQRSDTKMTCFESGRHCTLRLKPYHQAVTDVVHDRNLST